jgi:hypothetical protein
MLGSRLAWQDKVEVINKSETKAALASVKGLEGKSRALLVGGKLHADYVLFGSLTVFGNSVSIDAKMVDVSGKQEPVPFFAQTSSMGEVIPQINKFATDINEKVFGRTVARPAATASAQPAGTVPSSQAQPSQQAFDTHMNPEKMMQGGIQPEAPAPSPVAGQPAQAPNPAFVAVSPTATHTGGRTFWKSRNFNGLITGIAVADVDDDGKKETVVVTAKKVSVYRMERNRLVKVAEIAKTRTSFYLSVDVADINGNGTPEIYVTSLGPGKKTVDSFVIEYTGKKYEIISKDTPYYFRVARTIDRGTILLGQQQRLGASIFSGAIYQMDWQGDKLAPGPQILPGRKANLMGLAYGDVTRSGQSDIVAYSDWDRLRIYNPSGDKIWEDSDRTGGNTAYFSLPRTDPGEENKQFFPLRIRLTDINHDGKPEVMVARHEELAKNMLKNFRSFSKAQIESLEWDGLGLVPKWKTQQFAGRASDFIVADFDNDGKDELLISVVAKEGSIIFTDAVSSLIAFDLAPSK